MQRLHRLVRRSIHAKPPVSHGEFRLEGVAEPITWRHNDRARRYRLGLDRFGNPRLTIPRRGKLSEGQQFAERHILWLRRQIERRAEIVRQRAEYSGGDSILFRGELCSYRATESNGERVLCFAGENVSPYKSIALNGTACRQEVLRWMRRLAARELPERAHELARLHGLTVARVTVRNQRTRWGSCSNRRVISLNWRLVQVPEYARDYIILHELMHLREMNHSERYWKLVAEACPDYQKTETWLRKNNCILSLGD